MRQKWKTTVAGTGVGLGLVMDAFGVADLLGWGDLSAFRLSSIRPWLPLIVVLVGTTITCASITWVGYGMWERRPAARFQVMYFEVRALRDSVSDIRHGFGFGDTSIDGRLSELAVILEGDFGIECPRSAEEWNAFLRVLTPLARTGDVQRAQRLMEGLRAQR